MEDKLSCLPDEILQHILSFLETKVAVQTSVLCRRWRYLWVSIPVLNIDSESFRYYSSFANFVLNVLDSRRDASLTLCKFWFDISNPIYSSIQMCIDSHDLFEPLVTRVISHVVSHGVQHLSLHFPRIVDDLPYLFSCQSLATLELYELIILPRCFDLATLTTLHLVKCSFIMDEEDSFDPFRGCLNLTNLLISDCRIPSKVKIFEISAPHLTNLTISSMEHIRNLNPHCKIVLSSRRITSFNFIDSHILEFSVGCLPSIERVYVDVAVAYYLFGNNQAAKQKFILHLIDMFRAIGKAKTVILTFATISILSLFPEALRHPSPFTGMKILKVKVPHEPYSITIPVEVITFLLNGSPAKAFKLEFLKVLAQRSPSFLILHKKQKWFTFGVLVIKKGVINYLFNWPTLPKLLTNSSWIIIYFAMLDLINQFCDDFNLNDFFCAFVIASAQHKHERELIANFDKFVR